MKRKFHEGPPQPIVKTSISLPDVLSRFAQEKMAREGFATLSAYLTHLIRSDRDRDEEKRIALGKASGQSSYPQTREEVSRIEDQPLPAPKKKTGT